MQAKATFEDVAMYLRKKSHPTVERRFLFFKRRRAPRYPFPIRGGASESELGTFESINSVQLPSDVRVSYLAMDGTEDYLDLDAAWMRFWPISGWRRVAEEFPEDESARSLPLSSSYVFADHGISAWFYAIDLSREHLGKIYSLEPKGPRAVADCFSEFVALVLGDADVLFGAPKDPLAA